MLINPIILLLSIIIYIIISIFIYILLYFTLDYFCILIIKIYNSIIFIINVYINIKYLYKNTYICKKCYKEFKTKAWLTRHNKYYICKEYKIFFTYKNYD